MNTDKKLSKDGKTILTVHMILFPGYYLCGSVCICGFKIALVYRTNVTNAGPVPLATCKNAIVSPV
jgi:hypothetical protein